MPRRPWPVPRVQVDRLDVTLVPFVVSAAVAQVDAAHERDVTIGLVGMADDEHLLVVAAVTADPLVEQHLAAGLVHGLDEVQVLLLAEVRLIGVGPPDEAPDVHAAAGQRRQDLGDLGPRPGEPLVRIAAPVREVDPVVTFQRGELGVQPREVVAAVDEHAVRRCRPCTPGHRCGGGRSPSPGCHARPATGTTLVIGCHAPPSSSRGSTLRLPPLSSRAEPARRTTAARTPTSISQRRGTVPPFVPRFGAPSNDESP